MGGIILPFASRTDGAPNQAAQHPEIRTEAFSFSLVRPGFPGGDPHKTPWLWLHFGPPGPPRPQDGAAFGGGSSRRDLGNVRSLRWS